MRNFTFYNPTKIIFGKGTIGSLKREIPEGKKIMLVYGGGSIKHNGTYDEIMSALEGHEVHEFSGVEPNPTYETLMKCVEQVKATGCDFLLAAGGGSVIDGTKFIAAAALFDDDPWKIIQTFGACVKQALPFASVLTLPATGSEMNSGSVITRAATKAKLPFNSAKVFPVFSVLDPLKTYTLPPRQVANGIIDAFVHIAEQYLTQPAQASVQDRFAEGLLLTLIEEGPLALKDPENYDVRADLMWCATLALNGLIGAGVPQDWSTHMIGHELTALYGLDHAVTLAIVLPSNLTLRKSSKLEKLAHFGRRVWKIKSGNEEHQAAEAIRMTREFFESLGVKTRLSDYNIGAEGVEKVIAQLKSHQMIKLGENGDVNLEVSRQILELCL
ncbi:MAG: NADH-dependent alcohol dehydrogenase [Candidatus Riflebacteria bacterium HGW-Riflebacteria-2]|jgi:NADP-dependent alcohol dehydrogenase|nr:MAG: NADH-dependent alcohol dehydrogenase [Candidatus Riflebacteria bacterium HGW-Riflebacteria-2]